MSLSSLKLIGQTVFKLECGNENVDGQMDRQTNRRNYTNFKRNLAMMVIYVPVTFEFDWTNCFRVRVRKQNCGLTDEQIDKRTKNGQRNKQNYTNFKRNLAMMVIYVPVKFEFDWETIFKLESRNKKCGRTDRRWTRPSNTWVGYMEPA